MSGKWTALVPSGAEIVSFDDSPAPPGADRVIREIYHRAFVAAGLLDQ